MSELFSIQLQNRQQQGRDGVWLDLPTTTEQVQAALRQIGISSDNPQGLFISGYFAEEEKRFAISYNMVLASNVDELNFLASRLETLSTGERAELNAALQAPQSELFSIGRITDFPENVDYYVHLPDVRGPAQLGDYYLNRSGMVDMPEEWKGGIDTANKTDIIEIGGLELDTKAKSLKVDGEPVKLTATELKILELLMKNAGRIFSAEEIYSKVWNEDAYAVENTVMVHIRHIREKIEINPREPKYLKVVWGIGYKIEKI